MVAVIHSGKSLREALNYNENKVKKGMAELLEAGYYLKDPKDLGFNEKLGRLQKLMDLNENIKANMLHISLNFAPEESLSQQQLKEIAAVYLEKIGFAKQPYLLYEHKDVAHQHVHIVTTNIRPDGSCIKLHNIGRNQSEHARKEIEGEFGLVKAEQHIKKMFQLKPIDVKKVIYGSSLTKQAISNVLSGVLKDYKYCSIPELNAVLKQYNVMAYLGSEDSRIYKRKGLVYCILDEKGNRVGVQVKASAFPQKPTLAFLNRQFQTNESERLKHKTRIKNAVDFTLQIQQRLTPQALASALTKEGISIIFRRTESGQLYGITYVDHRTKCVFNGNALGKEYSAKAISERCELPVSKVRAGETKFPVLPEKVDEKFRTSTSSPGEPEQFESRNQQDDKILEDLFSPVADNSQVSWQLRRRRRRKARKRIN